MVKRILFTFTAVAVLLSMMTFVAVAEEKEILSQESLVQFIVGEADERGVFTATLSIHNAEFISYQFGIVFDKNVITLVNKEGEASEKFAEVAEAKDIIVGEKTYPLSSLEKVASNKEGFVRVAEYFFQPQSEDKVVPILEGGAQVYTFRFKKIADGDYGFALQDWGNTQHGKYALLNNGRESLDFAFSFIYPETESDKNSTHYYERKEEGSFQTSDQQPTGSDVGITEAERLRRERLEGTIVLQINNYAVSVNGVLEWVDKDNKNVVPYTENDITMVPLRFISETMGAEVTWVPETRTIRIALDETEISMQIDNTSYTLDGEAKAMDTAPVIREDRTMVPLRFIVEAFHKSVYWNEAASLVIVAPIDKPWDDKDSISQQLMTDTLWMFQWLRDEAYVNQK